MSWLEIFAWWFASGLLCSLFMPLRYRKSMKGHWPSFFKTWPVFGLFGPLAFVAAFPV